MGRRLRNKAKKQRVPQDLELASLADLISNLEAKRAMCSSEFGIERYTKLINKAQADYNKRLNYLVDKFAVKDKGFLKDTA